MVRNSLHNGFFQVIICVYAPWYAWFKHGLSTRVQLMMFMITLPKTKPQNTETAVAPELIEICPDQPCNPSVLSPMLHY